MSLKQEKSKCKKEEERPEDGGHWIASTWRIERPNRYSTEKKAPGFADACEMDGGDRPWADQLTACGACLNAHFAFDPSRFLFHGGGWVADGEALLQILSKEGFEAAEALVLEGVNQLVHH